MKKKYRSPLADQVKAYNVRDKVVIEIEHINGIMQAERSTIEEARQRLTILKENAKVVFEKLETAIDLAEKYRWAMVCDNCGSTFGNHKLVGSNCPRRINRVKIRWRTCKFKARSKQ